MNEYEYMPLSMFDKGALQLGMPNLNQLSFGSGYNPNTAPPAAAGFQFGMNAPTLQMGLSGLGTLSNIWGAWQANKLAKDQLAFTKATTNTNLNNSIKSYNTALEDRARTRGFTEGQSDSQIQNYVSSNRLTR